MYTLRDALRERAYQNAKMEARWKHENAKREEIETILKANPQIGILMRNGKNVYYTYPAGGKYKEAKHPGKLI
jgi:beta-lactam-binding protein with PASTA domain